MNEKSLFIQNKIKEIKNKLAKPITQFETGGFQPTNDKKTNWIGRVFLCKPNEAQPVMDKNGHPLYPLAQFYLPHLPYVPEQLKNIAWLTIFMAEDFPEINSFNGEGWLIREYTADEELIEYEFPQHKNLPKPFPLNPQYQAIDFPLWDGGGIPSDIEEEICELEDDEREDNECLDYYEDIVGDDHSYLHKFGGYPSYCQSGMGTIFENNCEFMFQISSDNKASFNVIDGGSLMFARNKKGDWIIYYDFC